MDLEQATSLVQQFYHNRSVRQLAEFYSSQTLNIGLRNVARDAGVLSALVQAVKIEDAALQKAVVRALGNLVCSHKVNQSAAVKAGAIHQVLQLTKSSDAALQKDALKTIGDLVAGHTVNQSVAASTGAIHQLIQLTKSSDTDIQSAAVTALGKLVRNHQDNQCAASAAGATGQLIRILELSKSGNPGFQQETVDAFCNLVGNCYANQSAITEEQIGSVLNLALSQDKTYTKALKSMVTMHFSNQCKLYKLYTSRQQKDIDDDDDNDDEDEDGPVVERDIATLLDEVLENCGAKIFQKLDDWCHAAQISTGVPCMSDETPSVSTACTIQTGPLCYAFAVARSFNHW
jgi:hypothetical protein